MTDAQKSAIEKYKKDKVKVNVNIDEEVAKEISEFCEKYGYTQKEFMEEAIRLYIDQYGKI